MPSRLILVAGPGGAGCSTYAARLADSLYAANPDDVGLVDLDPSHGALTRRESAVPSPSLDDDALGATASTLLDRFGLDARIPGEVGRLPGADLVRLLRAVTLVRTQQYPSVLVADVGSRLPDLLVLAERLPWLAARAEPAHRGWLSTVRPLTSALVGAWPGSETALAATDLRQTTTAWSEAMSDAEVVLVGAALDDRMPRYEVASALFELPVLTRVVDAFEQAAPAALPPPGERLTAQLRGSGSHWRWCLPLPSVGSSQIRISRAGDDLALEVAGVRRVVTLPSLLSRLRVGRATLRAGELQVPFGPDTGNDDTAHGANQEQG